MFKNRRMSGKMALGYGMIILMFLVISSLTIINLASIQRDSELLNSAYIPEVGIANEWEEAVRMTLYSLRGFELSLDNGFYEDGMAELRKVEKSLTEAEALGTEFSGLSQLRQGVDEAVSAIEAYKRFIGETKAAVDTILRQRVTMNESAASYLQEAKEYLRAQEEELRVQFSDGSGSAALRSRLEQIRRINAVIDQANEVRVTNFKGQAERDGAVINKALTELDGAKAMIAVLLADSGREENRRRLERLEERRFAYSQALEAAVAGYLRLEELKSLRRDAAEILLAAAEGVAAKGLSVTTEMSRRSVAEISSAITVVSIGLFILFLIALLIAALLTRTITRALSAGVSFAADIAAGDLSASLEIRQRDEIGQLADSLRSMQRSLQTKAQAVEKMAEGDLTVDVVRVSDRDGLGASLQVMKTALSDIISQINSAVEQVGNGSGQVSQSSQLLSQGATEQAASLEEISASVTEVTDQARQNNENAAEAAGMARQAAESAGRGNEEMEQLKSAMTGINSSAEDIRKVVGVIDDIAFQINLLALNANVEAARAGKYGKGFAVVAEEVRNLAVRSADAVKETTAMVEAVVDNIGRGDEVSRRTAEQLGDIVTGAAGVSSFLEQITTASQEQSRAIVQISEALEQIDQVTQNNSASSEESAAAAEELAAQSQQLKALVSRFRINAGAGRLTAPPKEPDIQESVYSEVVAEEAGIAG